MVPPHYQTKLNLTLSNPDADIWATIEGLDADVDGEVSFKLKRRAIDLVSLIKRCDEEVVLLQADMEHCLQHFVGQHAILIAELQTYSDVDELYSLGKHSLLSQQLFSIEIKLAKLKNVLSRHITINVNEFILLHPDEINEDEQQESRVPDISITLSDPDNCTLESDSDEDDEIVSDDDGPVWESQQFIRIEHIDSIKILKFFFKILMRMHTFSLFRNAKHDSNTANFICLKNIYFIIFVPMLFFCSYYNTQKCISI